MSKAIKTACSRWGVALFLDETEGPRSEEIPSIDIPSDVVTKTAASNIPQDAPSVASPAAPVSDIPFAPPVDDDIPPNTSPPTETPNKPTTTPNRTIEEPVFTDNNIVVPDPEYISTPSNVVAPSKAETVGTVVVETPPPITEEAHRPNGAVEKLTPVQKVAIESLMSINDVKFNILFTKAIPEQEVPTSLDEISYLDAVKLIQCGNHLKSGPSL